MRSISVRSDAGTRGSSKPGCEINRRHLSESRVERVCAYEEKSQRVSGRVSHSQHGQNTETASDFMCRGGILMIRRCSSPRVIASRCSQIASMCQLGLN